MRSKPLRIIDCSTDVTTLPTKAMIKYMLTAKVGDDSSKEDPSVNALLELVCSILDKEDAIFLPTLTMANLITFMACCSRGDAIYLDKTAHALLLEGGGVSLSGAHFREINGKNGIFDLNDLKNTYFFKFNSTNVSTPKLILIEQTTNLGGGDIWPINTLKTLYEYSNKNNVWLHIDGARLFNACIASRIHAKEYSKFSDSICIDFAKGLGAPMGAVLAGRKDFIKQCWRHKIQLGGGMHQAGFMAKACIYAIHNNIDRLQEDHINAKELAFLLDNIQYISISPDSVKTNILLFEINHPNIDAFSLAKKLDETNIKILPLNKTLLRIVTSMNIHKQDVCYIYKRIKNILS